MVVFSFIMFFLEASHDYLHVHSMIVTYLLVFNYPQIITTNIILFLSVIENPGSVL